MCDWVPMPSHNQPGHGCTFSPRLRDGLDGCTGSRGCLRCRAWMCDRVPMLSQNRPCMAVHSQRIFETALIGVEVHEVVGGAERGCVIGSPCLLLPGQRTVV